jgi:anaerobic magnesium-protoporphyrin IX monomethyl ester cyclase
LKLVLFNPKSNASGKRVLPFSLLALGAVLEGRHEYAIVDGNGEDDPEGLLRRHVAEGARVLGITAMPGPQLAAAVRASRTLKAGFPDLTTVWGGYFPTEHPEVCLGSDHVDYVVRGHGEEPFVRLLDALDRGEAPPPVPGLAWRTAGGVVRSAPVAPVPDPQELPPFPLGRLDVAAYLRRTFLGRRTLGYHSSYGCPFVCNFCGVVSLVGGRWRAQSAERVAAAVKDYVDTWGVDAVELYDNNFFTAEERTREFAARILPLRLSWWGEGRIDTLLRYAPSTWETLRASGLRMVFLGAESGSADTLRRMDKGGTLTPEMTLDLALLLRDRGIVPEFSFVVGNPPEPEEDTARTLELVRRIKRVHAASEIILYHYTPVPVAGALLDSARAGGFRFPETLDEWASGHWQRVALRRGAGLPWLHGGWRERVRDFERVLNAYYPTSTDARLTRWRRRLLRAASSWRYHARFYRFPLELRALQWAFRYQRPETAGF